MTAAGYPVSGRTVARMCKDGKLPSIRTGAGRYYRILQSAVYDFLNVNLDRTDTGA